ncbi:MAG: HAD-IA family hydrolase [Patescibacteria group bacterium]
MTNVGSAPGSAQVDTKELGKSIGDARRAVGLTQQELCIKAGLSYSTLAKIERGAIKTPSVFTVAIIAQATNTTVEQLIGMQPLTEAARESAPVVDYKTSKTGIRFIYFDINGVLVRFFHGAFNQLAADTNVSASVIETAFWHYNDAVCRGEMTMDEFNRALASRIKVDAIDWQKYYMSTIEPLSEVQECLKWAAEHYRVGLLSNIMPGFITQMMNSGVLPSLAYSAVIDSSVVGAIKPEPSIYQLATERSGVQAEEILFVDDSRTNLMAAERMGWQVLWLDDYQPTQSVDRIKQALEF